MSQSAGILPAVAPPRRFLTPRPHPHHRQTLLQYLFPRFLRDHYRERLIGFHLDTLPYYKHRVQSRIYRYILDRQRRRREQSRLVDHARRLLFGPSATSTNPKHGTTKALKNKMTSMPGYGVGSGSYGAEGGREKGARRRKLAAMAGSMYRAGAVAVNEIRESYNQTRAREIDGAEAAGITIPGSFPDVAIITKGNEQMVMFPSYAKRHVRGQPGEFEDPAGPPHPSVVDMNEEEYWRYEWARQEDEKAIVDVDVRGWIYNPHRGPMTRRNRVLIGLARQLSGIPPPRAQQADTLSQPGPSLTNAHRQHEEERERLRIAKEAQEIERKGQAENEAAQKGGYSERPKDVDSEDEGDVRIHRDQPSRNQSPPSAPSSPTLPPRTNTNSTEMSDAELAVANANLMARIGPFLTTPLVEIPITLFFYNDTQSQSRTVMTDDSGHFIIRAALDFIPTHVRVLANEDISCTEPVKVIEPRGVSLISDIDDTIKHSNIALGAKEIFRNTFVRDLDDLTVTGVKEWYNQLHDMGVGIHYCSNSPWQLYPVLATFFKRTGLPPGSLHLKRYAGMLQGIFEPVAERKKGTLEKIMNDFPERKFLLVGDSGEADLEVYTELAVANPGKIIAIFIRDVTTPEETGYFDSGFTGGGNNTISNTRQQIPSIRLDQEAKASNSSDSSSRSNRPALPPRAATQQNHQENVMGDLIDIAESPEPLRRVESDKSPEQQQVITRPMADLPIRKPPPPKPAKPTALQSASATQISSTAKEFGASNSDSARKPSAPTPPQPRRSTTAPSSNTQQSPSSQPTTTAAARSTHPLAQIQNSNSSSDLQLRKQKGEGQKQNTYHDSSRTTTAVTTILPPPPPPRRRSTPNTREPSPLPPPQRRKTGDPSLNSSSSSYPLLPPPPKRRFTPTGDPTVTTTTTTSTFTGNNTSNGNSNGLAATAAVVNKKVELWKRRLERAEYTLDRIGVPLYTWRRGEDVEKEAVGIVNGWLDGEIGR
ncbi:hypothetical protein F4810DRAFT_715519 [Camillea tinctor]|nr:hypothetical protein F4810DRAFT_715519 [Camillea tinctor]